MLLRHPCRIFTFEQENGGSNEEIIQIYLMDLDYSNILYLNYYQEYFHRRPISIQFIIIDVFYLYQNVISDGPVLYSDSSFLECRTHLLWYSQFYLFTHI